MSNNVDQKAVTKTISRLTWKKNEESDETPNTTGNANDDKSSFSVDLIGAFHYQLALMIPILSV